MNSITATVGFRSVITVAKTDSSFYSFLIYLLFSSWTSLHNNIFVWKNGRKVFAFRYRAFSHNFDTFCLYLHLSLRFLEILVFCIQRSINLHFWWHLYCLDWDWFLNIPYSLAISKHLSKMIFFFSKNFLWLAFIIWSIIRSFSSCMSFDSAYGICRIHKLHVSFKLKSLEDCKIMAKFCFSPKLLKSVLYPQ